MTSRSHLHPTSAAVLRRRPPTLATLAPGGPQTAAPGPTRIAAPSPDAVPAFRTPVRGHAFAAPPPGAGAPGPGAPARLVREPANPRDPLAVAVWTKAEIPWRVGYLDRAVAARLAPRLDDGQTFEVRVDGWIDGPDGAWRRPLVHVAPTSAQPDQVNCTPESVPPSPLAARPPGVTRRILTPPTGVARAS